MNEADDFKRRAAYDEAGHALIAWLAGCRAEIIAERTQRRNDLGKLVDSHAHVVVHWTSGVGDELRFRVAYGGRASQQLIFGTVIGDEPDRDARRQLLERMHPGDPEAQLRTERHLGELTVDLIRAHQGKLKRLAEAVLRQGNLSAAALNAILTSEGDGQ